MFSTVLGILNVDPFDFFSSFFTLQRPGRFVCLVGVFFLETRMNSGRIYTSKKKKRGEKNLFIEKSGGGGGGGVQVIRLRKTISFRFWAHTLSLFREYDGRRLTGNSITTYTDSPLSVNLVYTLFQQNCPVKLSRFGKKVEDNQDVSSKNILLKKN